MAEIQTCPGCGRNCPVSNLKCNRGRQLINKQNISEKREIPDYSSNSRINGENIFHSNHYSNNHHSHHHKHGRNPLAVLQNKINIEGINGELAQKLKELGSYILILQSKDKIIVIEDLFTNLNNNEKENLISLLNKINVNSEIIKTFKSHNRHRHHH